MIVLHLYYLVNVERLPHAIEAADFLQVKFAVAQTLDLERHFLILLTSHHIEE